MGLYNNTQLTIHNQFPTVLIIFMIIHVLALHRVTVGLKHNNPAVSCSQILNVKPNALSRYYWLQASNGSVIQAFCNMTLFPCQPGFTEVEAMCERKYMSTNINVHVLQFFINTAVSPVSAHGHLNITGYFSSNGCLLGI